MIKCKWLGILLAWSGLVNADLAQDVVADPTRLTEAVARDPDRKPVDMLRFSGLKPGQKVLEIAPASGYYTGLLSRMIGADGQLYGVDPARIFEFFPKARDGFQNYQAQDPRENVTYSIQNLDELALPTKVDQIWMVLYYHDTLWTGEDRLEMNRRFFNSLKRGGVMILIDHHGVAGMDSEASRTLHRMDADIAERELTAAGFVIEKRSSLLVVGSDPRDDSVFAKDRRGRTDRFLWLLRKP